MNILQERWIAKDGCIYTEKVEQKKSSFKGHMMQGLHPRSVAFNVGEDVAQYIVDIHNRELPIAAWGKTVDELKVISAAMHELHDRKPGKSAPKPEHDAWDAEMKPWQDQAIKVHYQRIELNIERLKRSRK